MTSEEASRRKAESVWQQKTDEELVAAGEGLSEFTPIGQEVVLAEIRRRGLPEPPAADLPAQKPAIETPAPIEVAALKLDPPAGWATVKAKLADESPSEITALRDRYRTVWYKHQAKQVGLGLLLVVTGLLLVWGLSRERAKDQSKVDHLAGGERLVGEAILGPKTFLTTAGLVAGFLGVPLGALVILWSIGAAAVGVPKAPKAASKTARRFIDHTFFGMDKNWLKLEAFVCLSRNARQGVAEDYISFNRYSESVTQLIREAIESASGKSGVTISNFEVGKIDIDDGGPTAIASAEITVTGTHRHRDEEGVERLLSLTPFFFAPQLFLANTAGRWYLASLEWHGSISEKDGVLSGTVSVSDQNGRLTYAYHPSTLG